jgi:hypothetical protein
MFQWQRLGFCCPFGILLLVWVFAVWFGCLLLVFRQPSDSASSPSPRSAPSIRSSQSFNSIFADGFDRDGFDHRQCSSPGFDHRDGFDYMAMFIAWLRPHHTVMFQRQ